MMKIAFYTLGCKVNQYETEAMRHMMEQAGWQTTDFNGGRADSDVLVINSCTVTGESDRKLRQLLRRCRRDNPTAILVLTGCMPQAYPETAASFMEADIVLGNAARRLLPTCVAEFLTHKQRIVRIPDHNKTFESLNIHAFHERTRAFVKIQDGCNRFCSYCIIPYARGRVRSRHPEEIRQELEQLAAAGYREVVLVGINLTAYGQDCGLTIADALDAACAVEGLERIRLGSLEPDFLTDALLERLSAQPKLCPQFHIALQSGCDATLRRMNRHYDTTLFADLCDRLRRLFPGCALTTDVMVGFPGETEEEFEQSLTFVQKMGFARVHVFPYSRRPGTPADKMPHQIQNATKAQRSRRLTEVCQETANAYAQTYIGRTVWVLPETWEDDGTVVGHTDTYLTVRVKTDRRENGQMAITITGRENDVLLGVETPPQ
ncbi:MAG: tRNA (N(6)-L-threonylcarbamoyladenosine(37)-C(2))-methylthiotransferase MtaB [Clostridia bacterium]|nr:tRNA (N(6)-L-threonylcarbamoyladenosine(37)-C(2))-methylthiotransferase MtaB [Loktanella sp.]MBQ1950751.1 tRNA (N(6)-L-threonylcarbamoyladenosine(37)-C(2))-methylthiotransferase MtaB [Clostridia bacterium]